MQETSRFSCAIGLAMHRRRTAGVCVASIGLAIAVTGGCKVYKQDLLGQRQGGAAAPIPDDDAGQAPVADAGDAAIDGGEGGISVAAPEKCDWGDCWWYLLVTLFTAPCGAWLLVEPRRFLPDSYWNPWPPAR